MYHKTRRTANEPKLIFSTRRAQTILDRRPHPSTQSHSQLRAIAKRRRDFTTRARVDWRNADPAIPHVVKQVLCATLPHPLGGERFAHALLSACDPPLRMC